MKRSERHHLKQNELVTGVGGVTVWVVENRRQVTNASLAIVGGALLLGGFLTYRSQQVEAGNIAFASAMQQFRAPVVREATEDRPAISHATERERFETSLVQFQDVADAYANYDVGRRATYYKGVCDVGLENYDAAAESFESVRGGSRDLLYYLAAVSLAGVKAENGDTAGAETLYLEVVNDVEAPLPKDQLIYTLGTMFEHAGNLESARKYYQRFEQEHPDSQLLREVTDRQAVIDHTDPT